MKQVALRDVSVRFGKLAALSEVDLEVDSGNVVVLAGPNGAGKSTLIKVLLGLVRPQAGSLQIDGQVRAVDHVLKQHLGYLPEAVAFADNLSGRQVMGFFARARGVPKPRVEQVLDRVGLLHAARRAVRGYSRGMRQRLGLGIAILAEPELLILDEPTGGLDQEGLKVLWSVLSEWRESGRMVLMATHDLALMEHRTDCLCVLRGGRVLQVGTPRHLRAEAGLPVRVDFDLDHGEALAGAFVKRVQRWDGKQDAYLEGNTLHVEVKPADLLSLMDLRRDDEDAVEALRVVEPGLDVVYEHLIEGAP